jgi:hypothetical protein
MSDSDISKAQSEQQIQHVDIDQDWIEDCLSDDEIDLPKGTATFEEEDDLIEGTEGGGENGLDEDDVWNDLGTDVFQEENRTGNEQ